MSANRTPYITILLVAVNCILFLLAEIITGSTEDTKTLVIWGGALVSAVRGGQYWRLATAMFMHSGIQHLLNNMLILYILGSVLENQLGRIRYTLLYLICGIAANWAAYRFYLSRGQNVVSVGASGAIFAVMGALIWIILRNRGRVQNLTLRQMLIMLAFSLYFGFVGSNIANAAHLAGLVSGFALSVFLYRKPKTAA